MKNPYHCKCLRCGHKWTKRIERRPARCPNCKQPKWDTKARIREQQGVDAELASRSAKL